MTVDRDPIYTQGRTAAETQRLIDQATVWDASTRDLMQAAGITTGQKVLDVGSGAGDVAFLAARMVGSTGSVVGVDQNHEILETARDRAKAAGLTNVTFLHGDFREADLPDDFDAAVGRLVLMYTSDLAGSIKAVASRVRPGGVVAFHEYDASLTHAYLELMPSKPLGQRLMQVIEALYKHSGLDLAVGLGLYRGFIEAGLGAPNMWLYAPLGGAADWPGYRLAADGIRSMLPLLEQLEVATADELDVDTLAERMAAEVEGTLLPNIVGMHACAWARKA